MSGGGMGNPDATRGRMQVLTWAASCATSRSSSCLSLVVSGEHCRRNSAAVCWNSAKSCLATSSAKQTSGTDGAHRSTTGRRKATSAWCFFTSISSTSSRCAPSETHTGSVDASPSTAGTSGSKGTAGSGCASTSSICSSDASGWLFSRRWSSCARFWLTLWLLLLSIACHQNHRAGRVQGRAPMK